MNQLRTYKFLIVPVLQLVSEDGVVVGERQPDQPDTVFGTEMLTRYAEGFEVVVQRQNMSLANGAGPQTEEVGNAS